MDANSLLDDISSSLRSACLPRIGTDPRKLMSFCSLECMLSYVKSQTERVWNEWRNNNDKAKKLSALDEIEIAMARLSQADSSQSTDTQIEE